MVKGTRAFTGTAVAVAVTGALVAIPAAPASAGTPDGIRDTIERFLDTRNQAVVTAPGMPPVSVNDFSMPMTDAFASATVSVIAELEATRRELSARDERYSEADTTVQVVEQTRTGDSLDLLVNERTMLTYERIHGNEPPFTAYSIKHTIQLALEEGVWHIAADTVDMSGIPPVTIAASGGDPISDDTPAPPLVDTSDTVAAGTMQHSSAADCGVVNGCDPTDGVNAATKHPFSLQYPVGAPSLPDMPKVSTPGVPELGSNRGGPPSGMDYKKIIDYAYQHWDIYNSAYRSWENDCTNFVSQALYAGGWPMDWGFYRSSNNWWYNFTQKGQTFTWAGAENWSRFAPKRTTNYRYTSQFMASDILQLDFRQDGNMNHSMIVTAKGTVPYLTYHTTDSVNVSLTYIESRHPYGSTWYYAYRT